MVPRQNRGTARRDVRVPARLHPEIAIVERSDQGLAKGHDVRVEPEGVVTVPRVRELETRQARALRFREGGLRDETRKGREQGHGARRNAPR